MTNDITGTISINGISFTSGAYVISGNAFVLAGDIINSTTQIQTFVTPLILSGIRTITVATGTSNGGIAGAVIFTGVLSGSGGITTAGSGNLILGRNIYTGPTTVSAGTKLICYNTSTTGPILVSGTLVAGGPIAFGTGTVTLNPGATLDISQSPSGNITNSNPYVWAGWWSWGGSGSLNVGGGAVTASNAVIGISLGGSSSNTLTFGGTVTNTSGTNQTLSVDGAGRTLILGGYALGSTGTNCIDTINGTGNVVISGSVTDGGSATASGLCYAGSGTLALTGTSTYHGPTIVSAGTLQTGTSPAFAGPSPELGANSAFQLGAGGTLNINGFDVAIGSLGDYLGSSGTVTNNNVYAMPGVLTIGSDNTNTTFGGAISDGTLPWAGIALEKVGSGTFALTGTCTYSGGASVAGGALLIAASALLPNVGGVSGGINVGPGAVLCVDGTINRLSTISAAGVVMGQGSVGSISIGGFSTVTLAPGMSLANSNTGTLTVKGSSSQVNSFSAIISFRLGAAGNDQLLVASNSQFVYGAQLQLVPIGGFNPIAGTQYTIIRNSGTSAMLHGTFMGKPEGSVFNITYLGQDYPFQVTYKGGVSNNDVVLTYLYPKLYWRWSHFGTTSGTGSAADTSSPAGDGIPNLMKYALNLDPSRSSLPGLPVTGCTTDGNYLAFTFRMPANTTDVIYKVQATGNLATDAWIDVPIAANTVKTGTDTDGTPTVTVRDVTPMSGNTRRFMRLCVVGPGS